MKSSKFFFETLLVLVLILSGFAAYFAFQKILTKNVTNFDECVKAKGSVLQTSYPSVCVTRGGKRFVEPREIDKNPKVTPETGEVWGCYPTYKVSTDSPELTADQVYSQECLNKENEEDCLKIDLYNQESGDFSSPDSIPDCEWMKKTDYCNKQTSCDGPIPCMANPASIFCTCMGGINEIRENEKGQYGICKIEETEYDEWEYFRMMNPTENAYQ